MSQLCRIGRQNKIIAVDIKRLDLSRNWHLSFDRRTSVDANKSVAAIRARGVSECIIRIDIIKRQQFNPPCGAAVDVIKCQCSALSNETDNCDCAIDNARGGAAGQRASR